MDELPEKLKINSKEYPIRTREVTMTIHEFHCPECDKWINFPDIGLDQEFIFRHVMEDIGFPPIR